MFCFVLKKKIMTKLHSSFSNIFFSGICSARKQSNIFLLLHNLTVFCFIYSGQARFLNLRRGEGRKWEVGLGDQMFWNSSSTAVTHLTHITGTTWNIKWARFKNTGKSLQWEQISCFDMAVSWFQRRLLWIEYDGCAHLSFNAFRQYYRSAELLNVSTPLMQLWKSVCWHSIQQHNF